MAAIAAVAIWLLRTDDCPPGGSFCGPARSGRLSPFAQRAAWPEPLVVGTRGDPYDAYLAAKKEKNPMAPLPWHRSQSEVMVDAMSVIRYFWKKAELEMDHLVLKHDIHSYWPAKLYSATQKLTQVYGKDVPPSPWKPVVAVYDIPNPKQQYSGLLVRKWQNLHRQGPIPCRGMTLAWAQTYVDQSAAERYRCDKDILWMLEVITREFPRRQVLVTSDRGLGNRARNYCTVRHPKWFEQEVLRIKGGKDAVEVLMGKTSDKDMLATGLPWSIRKAFFTH